MLTGNSFFRMSEKRILAKQVGYFDALRDLAETAVHKNGGLPAVLVAHSMGSLVSLYFIKRQGPEWTKKHLASLIAMSAPWEGAVTALKGMLPGLGSTLAPIDASLCLFVATECSEGVTALGCQPKRENATEMDRPAIGTCRLC